MAASSSSDPIFDATYYYIDPSETHVLFLGVIYDEYKAPTIIQARHITRGVRSFVIYDLEHKRESDGVPLYKVYKKGSNKMGPYSVQEPELTPMLDFSSWRQVRTATLWTSAPHKHGRPAERGVLP